MNEDEKQLNINLLSKVLRENMDDAEKSGELLSASGVPKLKYEEKKFK